jgi:hypothetical protein
MGNHCWSRRAVLSLVAVIFVAGRRLKNLCLSFFFFFFFFFLRHKFVFELFHGKQTKIRKKINKLLIIIQWTNGELALGTGT